MARIKIIPHVYNPQSNSTPTTRIQIRANSQIVHTSHNLPYRVDNTNQNIRTINDIRAVECFDGYIDKPKLQNIVISGASSILGEPNSIIPQFHSDFKMNILSKYLRRLDQRNTAVIIISGQGANSVTAFDLFRPLICTKDNPFYTPLMLDKYSEHLRKEYDNYCNDNRSAARNADVLKILIEILAADKRNVYDKMFISTEELTRTIDSCLNQGVISEEYATRSKQIISNNINSFENSVNFLSYYFSLLHDFLYPVIGDQQGYNTKLLNYGLAIQVKVRPLSESTMADSENIAYNKALSRLLQSDFKNNYNQSATRVNNIVVVLDHLSFGQAELFSWLWNDTSNWLNNQEHVFLICLQESYTKQMMRCADFDGKIDKWYYLNHNDGSDLEVLLGEKLKYNKASATHTEYGGIISVNRVLKIPTGTGVHDVPVYRPKYPKTFFQKLSPGEGLLIVRGEEMEHQFKCISD